MELLELKKLINDALDDCQSIISANRNAVLSESDFERLLSTCIAKSINDDIRNPHDFSVHTQVSHFFDEEGKTDVDRRVDILLLKESELTPYINHKRFKYSGESIAFELKYLHETDSVSKVKCDFCKWDDLKSESSLYVIVLIDTRNGADYSKKEQKIRLMYEDQIGKNDNSGQNQLFYRVLKKEI